MIELILAVGFAVCISAVCSLFEAVLYSVPLRHIEGMVHAGKPGGGIFKDLRASIERPIAAILSLNTIANTAGAAFAGSAAVAVLGYERLAYFSAFFTITILIFSEIIPKTVGVVYGRYLVSPVAYPLRGLVWFMAPLIWMSGVITRLISRNKPEDAVTAKDLLLLARLSFHRGQIKDYQERAIESILTLQQKRVKDVMTPRTVVVSFSEHMRLDEVSQSCTGWEHSRYPVYDEDPEDVVGIILTKEIFIHFSQGKGETNLSQLMRPVHFVAETARLHQVLLDFLERKEHLFVVLDEYGGMAGLITLEDILEEILGREIVDESDQVADKRELARRRRRQTATRLPQN